MIGWSAVLVHAEGVCEKDVFPRYVASGLGLYSAEGEPRGRVRGLRETRHTKVPGRNRFGSVRFGSV